MYFQVMFINDKWSSINIQFSTGKYLFSGGQYHFYLLCFYCNKTIRLFQQFVRIIYNRDMNFYNVQFGHKLLRMVSIQFVICSHNVCIFTRFRRFIWWSKSKKKNKKKNLLKTNGHILIANKMYSMGNFTVRNKKNVKLFYWPGAWFVSLSPSQHQPIYLYDAFLTVADTKPINFGFVVDGDGQLKNITII